MAGVAATAVAWTGLTTGVAMATYAGAGVATPAHLPVPVAYVGVRLTAAEVTDPSVDQALRRLGASAVVDDATARVAAGQVRQLAADGVNVANGGVGRVPDNDFPWDQAASDARAGRLISKLIDAPVTQAVPGRRLNAWDLVDCRHAHVALVVPDHILHVAGSDGPIRLGARRIYLVDGLGATPAQMADYLNRLQATFGAARLLAEPLSTLG
jgi:hypothetical protein